MPASYQLTVVNESDLDYPAFTVFASVPGQPGPSPFCPAWLTRRVGRGDRYVFRWSLDWGFAAGPGQLMPGLMWSPAATLPADPATAAGSAAELSYAGGAYDLQPAHGQPTGDQLTVQSDAAVPRESLVGVTLGGAPVAVVAALPMERLTFTLHPSWYVGAGEYERGQLIDPSTVGQLQALDFVGGNTSLVATLHADETWTVQPGQMADA